MSRTGHGLKELAVRCPWNIFIGHGFVSDQFKALCVWTDCSTLGASHDARKSSGRCSCMASQGLQKRHEDLLLWVHGEWSEIRRGKALLVAYNGEASGALKGCLAT